jgi:hypothetical protein
MSARQRRPIVADAARDVYEYTIKTLFRARQTSHITLAGSRCWVGTIACTSFVDTSPQGASPRAMKNALAISYADLPHHVSPLRL